MNTKDYFIGYVIVMGLISLATIGLMIDRIKNRRRSKLPEATRDQHFEAAEDLGLVESQTEDPPRQGLQH